MKQNDSEAIEIEDATLRFGDQLCSKNAFSLFFLVVQLRLYGELWILPSVIVMT